MSTPQFVHSAKMASSSDKVINSLPLAQVDYYPFDAENLWKSSKRGRKLAHREPWPRIPFMPIALECALPTSDIIRMFMKASDCILRWYEIKWPLIPTCLAKKLEANGEQYRLMHWEMQIRKNMLMAYYHLIEEKDCNIMDLVKKFMPAAPVFNGDGYTTEDRQKIEQYAVETAGNYLCLVPRTGSTKHLNLSEAEQRDLEHWRYVTYNNFTCKPKPAIICQL